MNDSMNGPPPRMPPGARHLLHEHPSTGAHRPPQDVDVRRVVALADVLAHLQGSHRIEVVPFRDFSVVLQPDLDPVSQPPLGDALVDEPLLLGRDRHADHPRAEVLGRVQRQRPPTAPDVEQAPIGPEVELAADQVELRVLGRLDGLVGVVAVVGARVGHRRVEDQRVELVRQVVVVADRPPVAAAGCAAVRARAPATPAAAAASRARRGCRSVRRPWANADRARPSRETALATDREGVGQCVARGRPAPRARR